MAPRCCSPDTYIYGAFLHEEMEKMPAKAPLAFLDKDMNAQQKY